MVFAGIIRKKNVLKMNVSVVVISILDPDQSLKKINNILKADIMAHNRTLGFVNDAATAAAAVLDLAIGIGALAA